ncbi:MAG: hypothetical protein ACRCUB_08365 [Plesiomonas shigelloides]
MADETQLRRIELDFLPEAVVLKSGAIRFRHYLITKHAIDRFVERCEKPSVDIIPMLHDAVLAEIHRAKLSIRRVLRNVDRHGGYVLYNSPAFFIVKQDEECGYHVISTVITPDP